MPAPIEGRLRTFALLVAAAVLGGAGYWLLSEPFVELLYRLNASDSVVTSALGVGFAMLIAGLALAVVRICGVRSVARLAWMTVFATVGGVLGGATINLIYYQLPQPQTGTLYGAVDSLQIGFYLSVMAGVVGGAWLVTIIALQLFRFER